MPSRSEMVALAEKLERYAGIWDSRHDEEIARVIGWDQDADGEWHQVGMFFNDGIVRRTSYAVELPPFTRSLDAALSLVPEGHSWAGGDLNEDGSPWACVTADREPCTDFDAAAATPAVALCAASLRARAALEAGDE